MFYRALHTISSQKYRLPVRRYIFDLFNVELDADVVKKLTDCAISLRTPHAVGPSPVVEHPQTQIPAPLPAAAPIAQAAAPAPPPATAIPTPAATPTPYGYSSSTAPTSAAALGERGVMLHLNSFRWLLEGEKQIDE